MMWEPKVIALKCTEYKFQIILNKLCLKYSSDKILVEEIELNDLVRFSACKVT